MKSGVSQPGGPVLKRRVMIGVGTPFIIAIGALLALYIAAAGVLPFAKGPGYSVAQVTSGLRMHPRRWVGRIVSVRGVVMRPVPDGFELWDHNPTPSRPYTQVLWVVSIGRNRWRTEAMMWQERAAQLVPGLGWFNSEGRAAVYRLRLPAAWCLQGDQCPGILVQ